MKNVYYVDSCIWLNLFKKEGDEKKGKPYWKIARDFLEMVEKNRDEVVVFTIVIKEISFKADDKLEMIINFLKNENYIKIIKTKNEDYDFARFFERKKGNKLSFYDFLHVAVSYRLNAYLITRDKELIDACKNIINVCKPEELIS